MISAQRSQLNAATIINANQSNNHKIIGSSIDNHPRKDNDAIISIAHSKHNIPTQKLNTQTCQPKKLIGHEVSKYITTLFTIKEVNNDNKHLLGQLKLSDL